VEEETKNASPFQKISDLWTWFGFQFSKFRWGQSNLRQYMLLALVPVLCVLAYQIFYRRKRGRSVAGVKEKPDVWPGLDSEFYLIEKKLAQRGILRHPEESLSDWLQRALADPHLANTSDPLRELLQLHYRYRFDPNGLSEADREKLRHTARACLQTIAARQD
jgi:protein-glutamine gamma-glutamyltransferase